MRRCSFAIWSLKRARRTRCSGGSRRDPGVGEGTDGHADDVERSLRSRASAGAVASSGSTPRTTHGSLRAGAAWYGRLVGEQRRRTTPQPSHGRRETGVCTHRFSVCTAPRTRGIPLAVPWTKMQTGKSGQAAGGSSEIIGVPRRPTRLPRRLPQQLPLPGGRPRRWRRMLAVVPASHGGSARRRLTLRWRGDIATSPSPDLLRNAYTSRLSGAAAMNLGSGPHTATGGPASILERASTEFTRRDESSASCRITRSWTRLGARRWNSVVQARRACTGVTAPRASIEAMLAVDARLSGTATQARRRRSAPTATWCWSDPGGRRARRRPHLHLLGSPKRTPARPTTGARAGRDARESSRASSPAAWRAAPCT